MHNPNKKYLSNQDLDRLKKIFKIKSDAKLAKLIGISAVGLSKARTGDININYNYILNVFFNKLGMDVEKLLEIIEKEDMNLGTYTIIINGMVIKNNEFLG